MSQIYSTFNAQHCQLFEMTNVCSEFGYFLFHRHFPDPNRWWEKKKEEMIYEIAANSETVDWQGAPDATLSSTPTTDHATQTRTADASAYATIVDFVSILAEEEHRNYLNASCDERLTSVGILRRCIHWCRPGGTVDTLGWSGTRKDGIAIIQGKGNVGAFDGWTAAEREDFEGIEMHGIVSGLENGRLMSG